MARRNPVIVLGILALVFAEVQAARKLVVPQECRSIQKALDEAESGDTVFVLNGIYKGHVVLKEGVFFIGQDKERTILRGTRMGPVIRGVNYSTIRNFTIERGETGIICENTNTVIENTIIRGNRTGIHCLVSLPEIRNNIIYRNKWTGIFCELVSFVTHTGIEHNIIAENGYSGLSLVKKSAVLVQNNIFAGNEQYGIFVDWESTRSRIVYNNFFNNRFPFNNFAVIDQSNQTVEPGFPVGPNGMPDYLKPPAPALRGTGKDGRDIGLMSEADRLQPRRTTGWVRLPQESSNQEKTAPQSEKATEPAITGSDAAGPEISPTE